jgi:hypothetical protein
LFDVTDWILSDPYVRDISTIKASPNLASQAPIDNRMILVKIDSDDDAARVIGISITSLSIKASKDRSDISKWFLLIIKAIIADSEHSSIISVYEFISI